LYSRTFFCLQSQQTVRIKGGQTNNKDLDCQNIDLAFRTGLVGKLPSVFPEKPKVLGTPLSLESLVYETAFIDIAVYTIDKIITLFIRGNVHELNPLEQGNSLRGSPFAFSSISC
jgi:hypothetical protein